jgi:Domain of unknown function (DUF4062)
MKKKLQVFVSSTYTDMLAERQAAVEAILRARHIPAGMELFAAGDESQLETIRRWIDDSDVFMLILGGRYGSVEPKSGKSYIELEYEYASKKKKPLFAAVINDAFLEAKVKEVGPAAIETLNGHLLKAFREDVTKRICRFFGDVNELKLIVFESLACFEQNEDLAGWIHGSDVVDPKAVLEEVDRLQAENAELRRQMAEWEAAEQAMPSRESPASLASLLSEDAKRLLVAAKSSDGDIMYVRYMGGASIQAANKNFIEPYSDREEARWRAALDELHGYRLIESSGSEGEVFRLTKLGYEVADEIERAK